MTKQYQCYRTHATLSGRSTLGPYRISTQLGSTRCIEWLFGGPAGTRTQNQGIMSLSTKDSQYLSEASISLGYAQATDAFHHLLFASLKPRP